MTTTMNGEINGTMDESTDPAPIPDENKSQIKKDLSEELNVKINHNSESNHSDNISVLSYDDDDDDDEMKTESADEDENDEDLYDVLIGGDSKTLPERVKIIRVNPNDDSCPSIPHAVAEEIISAEHSMDGDDDEIDSKDGKMENDDDSQEVKDNSEQINNGSKENSTDNMSLNSKKKRSSDAADSEDSVCISQVEDTVSIPSDSDLDHSGECHENDRDDVIILDTDTKTHNGKSANSEVHEIVSDNEDCVVTEEVRRPLLIPKEKKVELRRSSRAIKRKKYDLEYDDNDESDIEEILMEDPVKRKSKAIVINDTKKLVEIAAKHSKSQKKEHTVVIIDTNNSNNKNGPSANKMATSTLNASIYQSMVARGTTVTPVNLKTTSTSTSTQANQTPQPVILPSLTDDMYVVEAPSFIVPYVYEKPSVKPFREFVDKLGKEIEEQKIKEEKEVLEKLKLEKEQRQKEREEKRKNGEDVEKKEKKERRRKKHEDDDSWDGSDTSESEEDTFSDPEIRDKSVLIEEHKDAADATSTSSKSENYFDCSLGKFFMDIGMNLVQEYVQTDLLKQQKKKLQREKKTGQCTKERELSLSLLTKNLELSQTTNEPYKLTQKKCKFCSFKTESDIILANHLETPHMKNNLYKCNFCEFQHKSPRDILFHVEAEHNFKAKLERAPSYHQCVNCPFEDNGKGKLARHLIACAKRFKPEQNLAPPLEWEPPAKIPKIARARNNSMPPYPNNFGRPPVPANMERPSSNMGMGAMSMYRPRPRQPPRGIPIAPPLVRSAIMRQNAPTAHMNAKGRSMQQAPSISITPLPRHPIPTPTPVPVQSLNNSKNTFVICEICDGYIKDLEQLRNHMQWIHKVKIHPKMIYNRPPLNCQKCQFRFFTDQGLERHLLGSHGLVTSSMQEAANKGKDAGRCPVCGRVYQWKLLNHVARDHNLTLKPAHLSYKCTVCTATFGMYKQFENHVYSAHSVVAKRVMDKNKTPASQNKLAIDTNAQLLKINNEITVTPQPLNMTINKNK